VLLRGHLPGTRRRIGKVEMYEQGRFFTFTGDHVAAQWATRMRNEYAALDTSYRKYPLGQLVGRYMRAISFEGKAENTRLSYSPSCACSCSSSATWRRSSLWAWISCTSS
jgi:hypothetical protein